MSSFCSKGVLTLISNPNRKAVQARTQALHQGDSPAIDVTGDAHRTMPPHATGLGDPLRQADEFEFVEIRNPPKALYQSIDVFDLSGRDVEVEAGTMVSENPPATVMNGTPLGRQQDGALEILGRRSRKRAAFEQLDMSELNQKSDHANDRGQSQKTASAPVSDGRRVEEEVGHTPLGSRPSTGGRRAVKTRPN
jgi:hypothetical protein